MTDTQPSQNQTNLTVLQRRKLRILNNNQDRLGLITGKIDKIEEKPITEEDVIHQQKQNTSIQQNIIQQQNSQTENKQESPIANKLKNVGIAFLILFIGTFIAHFAGYSLLPSEFIEGFICCLFMVVAGILLLIRKLIQLLPALAPPSSIPEHKE
ncbi:hypothetical protein EHI8A_015060 [Entamoeba histolytica HM-1:IMSS-B]|uniref:Uncharacterized protein n=6 Tax=Entamoeba histolytica TaxID=5759 RepID=C4LTD1_ENTH1|nr:hypothetical protein EHI_045180 [Entamoeba histolytica HM-1:IMSS]EMD45958.1 Hypothetical protein EHI5A_036830 [Entamoeba histolytica KU27]EMH76587.1 hypothetical protein EHI8A_015060 [Entamoeba histolytica HM-1:IMSS-B]EMS12410.1 hypothetical protein KM1_045060 [Entamoeba histolytica HM-3:IMSS]ENY62886.1 hypothetical protein EHI7A_020200 [Entamoeba histolytica HM-1:IMSS-A]GAT91815.1 hypothetical protein CL6EHI_045180 [Entamoeba histolytica]|eukprot:XP_657323.1 hypothetical protein EHI_045180 [Entamoeba histolytica HM-1:IMSS]